MASKVSAAKSAALAVVAALTMNAVAAAVPDAAGAATNVIQPGDIEITTFGGFLDGGSGVDRVNPADHSRSRIASFGFNHATNAVATAPNGDLYVANRDKEIQRIDHVTGAADIINEFDHGLNSIGFADMIVDRDGTIVATDHTDTGLQLVRIDPTVPFSAATLIGANDALRAGDGQFAIADNGDIWFASNDELWRLDDTTDRFVFAVRLPAIGEAIAIDHDGRVLVQVESASDHAPEIVRFTPGGKLSQVIASGGLLRDRSPGMALQSDGRIVLSVVNPDKTESVIRVDPVTRAQEELVRVGLLQANDITIAGVSQVGGPIRPTALNDSFTLTRPASQVTGNLLSNDRDPSGSTLHYQGITSPSHGTLSITADGAMTYTPDAGFSGIETWAYRAVTRDGRTSNAATVSVTVVPDGTPIARNDGFTVRHNKPLHVGVPGLLANDTDAQGQKLEAHLATNPLHGTVFLGSDGSLIYDAPAGYVGPDSFTYAVTDPDGNRSAAATVYLTVAADLRPVIAVSNGTGLSAGNDNRSGTFPLFVTDAESPASGLKLIATSSNLAVVPASGLVFSGQSEGRPALAITANTAAGKAVVTVTVSDGELSTSLTITVISGTAGADVVTGTTGPDLLIGGNGADRLSAGDGRDVLVGGNENDTLTGGAGADLFHSGDGTDTVTDFSPAQGDSGN